MRAMNSLGLPKTPAETRVVVAMSGGVDSSVTAALLREEGYDVVGMTMRLYDPGLTMKRSGTCCAGQDIYDAARVADRIGIPHYVVDFEGRFGRDVIDDFADSYLRGETPVPCVRCNQRTKFQDLLNAARDLGADAMATGHYVRRTDGPGGAELRRGVDPGRDQSYFLFATTREQLEFLRFPLGALDKPATRAAAERFGLEVAAKPDSQDICFAPDGDYASVVAELRPGAIRPGEIVHVDGRVLGRHEGIVHYTIGQRRGLGIGGRKGEDEPLYVTRLEAATRRVIVGPRAALARSVIRVREVNWLIDPPDETTSLDVAVKVRSTQPAVSATLTRSGTGAVVRLIEPQFGVAPGQACVFYDGDRVVGGGWIEGTDPLA